MSAQPRFRQILNFPLIFPSSSFVPAALATSIMAATLPLLNVIGVFVYSFFAETGEKPDLKRAAVNAMKNPIIWGVVLGAAFSEKTIE